mgnify:CR=1 FL=1
MKYYYEVIDIPLYSWAIDVQKKLNFYGEDLECKVAAVFRTKNACNEDVDRIILMREAE